MIVNVLQRGSRTVEFINTPEGVTVRERAWKFRPAVAVIYSQAELATARDHWRAYRAAGFEPAKISSDFV